MSVENIDVIALKESDTKREVWSILIAIDIGSIY